MNIREVSKSVNIPRTYLNYRLKGKKNKHLFEDYVESGLIVINRKYKVDLTTLPKHKLKKQNREPSTVTKDKKKAKLDIVLRLRSQGKSYQEIVNESGISKTTVARLLKEHNS